MKRPRKTLAFFLIPSVVVGIVATTAVYVRLALTGVLRTEYYTTPESNAIMFVPSGIVHGAMFGICAGFVAFILYRTFRPPDDGSTHC